MWNKKELKNKFMAITVFIPLERLNSTQFIIQVEWRRIVIRILLHHSSDALRAA